MLPVVNVVCDNLHTTVRELHIFLRQKRYTYAFCRLQVAHLERDVLADSENIAINSCEVPSWGNDELHFDVLVVGCSQCVRDIVVELHHVFGGIFAVQENL